MKLEAMRTVRKKQKLESFLTRLNSGIAVQNRDLRIWLSADVYADYLEACKQQTELRAEIKQKPMQIIAYEARLKRALFVYNKAEGASAKGRSATARKFYNNADVLFERTLEFLQEIIYQDQSLCVWFDRDTTWAADAEAGCDPVSIPRVVTSRSLDNNGGGLLTMLQDKAALKITAVEREIERLGADVQADASSQVAALRSRLDKFMQQTERN